MKNKNPFMNKKSAEMVHKEAPSPKKGAPKGRFGKRDLISKGMGSKFSKC